MINIYHNTTKIGEAIDQDSAFEVMNAYLDQIKFKYYYMRSWTECGITTVDYGSYINFFYLKED